MSGQEGQRGAVPMSSAGSPVAVQGGAPFVVPFGATQQIDLSGLPEPQRVALLQDYQRGVLDISRKAQELGVEVQTLAATLGTLSGTVEKATNSGSSVTATYTNSSSIGRVEVIIGNTESAKAGKLSRTQTGERDWTPFYILGGLVALVLIAALLGGR